MGAKKHHNITTMTPHINHITTHLHSTKHIRQRKEKIKIYIKKKTNLSKQHPHLPRSLPLLVPRTRHPDACVARLDGPLAAGDAGELGLLVGRLPFVCVSCL